MRHWWEIDANPLDAGPPRPKAVAYYRHSAQDRHYVAHPVMWRPVPDFLDFWGRCCGGRHIILAL